MTVTMRNDIDLWRDVAAGMQQNRPAEVVALSQDPALWSHERRQPFNLTNPLPFVAREKTHASWRRRVRRRHNAAAVADAAGHFRQERLTCTRLIHRSRAQGTVDEGNPAEQTNPDCLHRRRNGEACIH